MWTNRVCDVSSESLFLARFLHIFYLLSYDELYLNFYCLIRESMSLRRQHSTAMAIAVERLSYAARKPTKNTTTTIIMNSHHTSTKIDEHRRSQLVSLKVPRRRRRRKKCQSVSCLHFFSLRYCVLS